MNVACFLVLKNIAQKENNLRTIKESGKGWAGGRRFHSCLQFIYETTRGKEEVMADTKRRGRQGGSWGRGGEEGGIRPGEEDLSAWRCALSKGSYVGKLHSSNVTVGCGNNQE